LSGTPDNGDVGTTSGIVIRVTDSGSASDSLAAFALTVTTGGDTGGGSGDSNLHYQDETQRLSASGDLVLATSLRSAQEIDKYRWKENPESVSYDPGMDGCRMAIEPTAHEQVAQRLQMQFNAVTSGKLYIQYEVRFSDEWSTFNHVDRYFNKAKYVRVRQDSLSHEGEDERVFDFQIRMDDSVCRNSPACPVAVPSVRYYHPNTDPLKDGSDFQPGGDTSYINGTTATASDHPRTFLYLPNRWIRETYEVDFDNRTLKVWMSDENTDTVLVMADPSNSSKGYPLSNAVTFRGIDEIRFAPNSSSRSYDDPGGNPTLYMWHRNLIVSTSPISINGLPK